MGKGLIRGRKTYHPGDGPSWCAVNRIPVPWLVMIVAAYMSVPAMGCRPVEHAAVHAYNSHNLYYEAVTGPQDTAWP